ncbi:site-specific integrase [Domibacillus indicus]|uniref:tyrosine-type recombinase/integrase n=1 Tax=Domibacillus indicus TaxID=1437523 RepID=UPI00203F8D64|nr:site-specific integrase [Domibacillus indicus]MCM3786907.1 site-specific integrase [Domibacillus indicus]
MSKKNASLTVNADLSDLFIEQQPKQQRRLVAEGMPIEKALFTITRHMEATGFRERTISDYRLHVTHFAKITGVQFLDELTADHIYEWLSSMNVSNQTKLTRLKCLKAFLGRCFDLGWVQTRFWRAINIKVDSPVKTGAAEKDIRILLHLLDLTRFVELRDAAAILMMYQTGLRVGTIAKLENKHVDIQAKLLKIDGSIVKNHEQLHLPIGDDLARLLDVLMRQNDVVRRHNRCRNDFVFITKNGGPTASGASHNNIQKRLAKYAREYGLKNINPHALRRGFAKNLLDKGANVAMISRALGHSDIAVTSRYLHLDKEEVAESLRRFL